MKVARVKSRCECQAVLVAELDEHGAVVRGFEYDPKRHRETAAPANATLRDGGQLGVGWSCPVCTRNVLRSFNPSALVYS